MKEHGEKEMHKKTKSIEFIWIGWKIKNHMSKGIIAF